MAVVTGPVSVVIPLYNGATHIGATLESALAQTLRPARIIVVDDRSTDGSPEIVGRFRGVDLVTNTGRGGDAGRQTGLALVDTPYVAFLDHDDVWHPDHLRLAVAALEAQPEVAGVAARVSHFKRPRQLRYDLRSAGEQPVVHDVWSSFPFPTGLGSPSAVVLSREHLEACGGWADVRRSPSDLYMWFRLGIGRPFARLATTTVGYRIHGGSMTKALVVRDPRAFSDQHLDLLHDALIRYAAAGAADEVVERASVRLDAFADLLELVDVLRGAGSVDLDKAVRRVHEAMAADAHLARCFPGELRYRLSPLLPRVGRARAAFLAAYASWPDDLVDTRRALLDRLVVRACSPLAVAGAVVRSPLVLAPRQLPASLWRGSAGSRR